MNCFGVVNRLLTNSSIQVIVIVQDCMVEGLKYANLILQYSFITISFLVILIKYYKK